MKKILTFCLMGCVVLGTVSALADTQTETQIKKMMNDWLSLSGIECPSDILLKPEQTGYQVTVPNCRIAMLDKEVPTYTFSLKEKDAFEGKKRYSYTLDNLNQIAPVLSIFSEQFPITHDSAKYTQDIVPDMDLILNQKSQVQNLVFPIQDIKISIGKIEGSLTNTKEGDHFKGENSMSFDDIQISHMLGNGKITRIFSELVTPVKISNNFDFLKEAKQFNTKMTIDGVQIDSLFAKASFNLDGTADVKINEKDEINLAVVVKGKDIVVSEQKDIPQNVLVDFNISGVTTEQISNYEKTMRALNEIQDLPESEAKKMMLQKAFLNFQEAQENVMSTLAIKLNQAKFESDKYIVVMEGNINLKQEQIIGSISVVNFDYLASEPKPVNEAECKKVMDKVLDGSLKGDAFEKEFNDKCNEQKGILNDLRQYAATAQKTKIDGKDALKFDIVAKDGNITINGQPFSF